MSTKYYRVNERGIPVNAGAENTKKKLWHARWGGASTHAEVKVDTTFCEAGMQQNLTMLWSVATGEP